MKKLLLALAILAISIQCMAATYYAAPMGSKEADDAASGTGTIEDPWSITRAFAAAQAGDTVYFRGGVYYGGQSNNGSNAGYWNPTNSGSSGNPITFAAYSGENPIIDCAIGGAYDHTYGFGSSKDFITFDGFKFIGDGGTTYNGIIIAGSGSRNTNNVIIRCTFQGAETTLDSTDNFSGIALTTTSYLTISRCTIHNFLAVSHNGSAIKSYDSDNIIVENCEIYNCTAGIYYKRYTDHIITRYNFIHNCTLNAVLDNPGSSAYSMGDHVYYHNVVYGTQGHGIECQVEDGYSMSDYTFNNNTIYISSSDAGTRALMCMGGGVTITDNSKFYNNIIIGGEYNAQYSSNENGVTECDYNQYGPSIAIQIQPATTVYSTLASWQASGIVKPGNDNPDTSGLSSAINTIWDDVTPTNLADFATKTGGSCDGTGKGGDDIGADITLVGTGAETPDPPASRSTASGTAGWR